MTMQNMKTALTQSVGGMLFLLGSGLFTGAQAQELVEMVAQLEPSVFEIHSFGENGLPVRAISLSDFHVNLV